LSRKKSWQLHFHFFGGGKSFITETFRFWPNSRVKHSNNDFASSISSSNMLEKPVKAHGLLEWSCFLSLRKKLLPQFQTHSISHSTNLIQFLFSFIFYFYPRSKKPFAFVRGRGAVDYRGRGCFHLEHVWERGCGRVPKKFEFFFFFC